MAAQARVFKVHCRIGSSEESAFAVPSARRSPPHRQLRNALIQCHGDEKPFMVRRIGSSEMPPTIPTCASGSFTAAGSSEMAAARQRQRGDFVHCRIGSLKTRWWAPNGDTFTAALRQLRKKHARSLHRRSLPHSGGSEGCRGPGEVRSLPHRQLRKSPAGVRFAADVHCRIGSSKG